MPLPAHPMRMALAALLLAGLGAFAVGPALANEPPPSAAIEAQDGPAHLKDPALEARAVALQKQLRCMVCQGESLNDSNAQLAKDMRRLIRKRILEGYSNAEIKAYFVSRYGDFILMKPPLKTDTVALWFGPLAVLLIAAGVAGVVVLRARRRAHATIS